MKVVSDIETNALDNPDKLWLFGGIDVDTKERFRFDWETDPDCRDGCVRWAKSVDHWVGHNFLVYDAPWINKLTGQRLIKPETVTDTMLVSRLVHYDRPVPKGGDTPHSLKSWGIRLGVHKGDFNKFEEFSQEMVDYWEGDLDTTLALHDHLSRFIYNEEWESSIRVEHDTQIELVRTHYYGFAFNRELATSTLDLVKSDMKKLEEVFQEDFPPELRVAKVGKYKKKTDGTLYQTTLNLQEKYPLTKVDGEDLYCYEYYPFNPGSPKDRIRVLNESGWKPFDKTDTHQRFLRLRVGDPYGKRIESMSKEFYAQKKAEFEVTGWKVNEDNLATLPENAPDGAKALAQWLTLEGRRSSLTEWLGQVRDDSRIHGNINALGAWTGRGSHNSPNTANISRVFHGTPRSPVEEIKLKYDASLRECWEVLEGSFLVGADADGIQLRILADYLWRHYDKPAYANAILKGKKEDETDIHNMNRKALGLNHITRDDAKTFIYAWALNAAAPKLASILLCDIPTAAQAKDRFENSIDGLKPFKYELLPYIANKGFFTGYDGRKVIVPNLHKTLAGILQNGEAVVMKWAQREWHKELRADGIRFKMVGWIHDEWQTEVIGTREEAEHVLAVQSNSIRKVGEELGFMIPLEGSGSIGLNWKETH